MEKSLNIKYKIANQALSTLQKSIDIAEKQISIDEEISKMMRDSVIKRFEYSVDTIWKYVKLYLKERYGVERNSPKPIFRECLANNVLSKDETTQALNMVDDRNLAVHTYKEELANNVYEKAKGYCGLLKKLLERAQPTE